MSTVRVTSSGRASGTSIWAKARLNWLMARGPQHDLIAVKLFGAQQRRRGGAGQDQILEIAGQFVQVAFQMVGGEFHLVLVPALEGKQGDAAEGRIFQLLAEFDFLLVRSR